MDWSGILTYAHIEDRLIKQHPRDNHFYVHVYLFNKNDVEKGKTLFNLHLLFMCKVNYNVQLSISERIRLTELTVLQIKQLIESWSRVVMLAQARVEVMLRTV